MWAPSSHMLRDVCFSNTLLETGQNCCWLRFMQRPHKLLVLTSARVHESVSLQAIECTVSQFSQYSYNTVDVQTSQRVPLVYISLHLYLRINDLTASYCGCLFPGVQTWCFIHALSFSMHTSSTPINSLHECRSQDEVKRSIHTGLILLKGPAVVL